MSSSRTIIYNFISHLKKTPRNENGGLRVAEKYKAVERTRTLDVADDASGCVVHEFDPHLCDTTTGT